jgi:excisionase family DNA binding protein
MPKPPADIPELTPLLVSRETAAKMLGVSASTIYRMQASHGLKPIKLSGTKAGVTHYRYSDIQDLVAALVRA